MARRNLLRSLLAASVVVVSSTTGPLVASPAPAGAAESFEPDYRVTVYETKFSPSTIYARPNETVQFDLAPGVGTNHTVTLENGTCGGRPTRLCERTFDDPDNPPVFRFSNYGEYRYYDRIAREAGQHDMGGVIVIMDNPPPTTTSTTSPPPSTTSTTQPTTTTTQPTTTTSWPVTTTTPSTTTTTDPSTIRPFVIADPPPTAVTTAAPNGPGGSSDSSVAVKDQSKGKGKDKGEEKDKGESASGAAEAETPSLPDGPLDVVFDEASLTPLPDLVPTEVASTPDSGAEEAALFDLLSGDEPAGGDSRPLSVGFGALALVVLGGGLVAWFRRSSRYFPA